MLDNALALAEIGFAVFPIHYMKDGLCSCGNPKCGSPAKHPLTGRGVLDASVNTRTIRAWWERWPLANIAIATGERSGIVVLDIDGVSGFESLGNRPLPETPSVSTGRGDGGIHYYFRHPGGTLRNTAGKLGKNLDTRADGGYVIAPPSIHASGNTYFWNVAPENYSNGVVVDTAPLADMPEWLIKAFSEKTKIKGDVTSDTTQVIEGGRNTFLASIAGKMRRDGFSYGAIRAALIIENATKCVPPLPEEEVERTAQSISTYPSREEEETVEIAKINFSLFDTLLGELKETELCATAKLTDVGNAEVFADLYGERFRYDYTRKRWLVWANGAGVWREDMSGAANRAFMATLRMREYASIGVRDDEYRKALRNWIRTSERNRGIAYGLGHAATLKGIAVNPNDFDQSPTLLNCMNGLLNLETGNFRETRPEDMVSRQAAVSYDKDAKAPRWERFIQEVFNGDQELIAYVQRVLGYCLTGDTREQAFFIAHGSGANGKSTLLGTVRKVLGDYGATTPFDTFDADSRNSYGNDLAALKGRRYVLATESEQTRKLAEARVKTITGKDDEVSCRFLYGEFFSFVPTFKVILAVNHKPIVRGADHGIWRRIHLIPFNVTFGTEEHPMDKYLDRTLSEESSGILNWLIQGYQEWRSQGLNPPASVRAATEEYKIENDHVAAWLEENCTEAAGERMSATNGYENFVLYLKSIGEIERGIPTMRAWGQTMSEKGFQRGRGAGGRVEYLGVSLKPIEFGRGGKES